jgi:DNA-binding NtrC family response regulator
MVPHLLIVDDDSGVRASLSDALAMAGLRVSEASCGQDALDRLELEAVDLVLTDLRMPGLDGLELLRRVRAGAPGVDVVLMSAYDDAAASTVAAREGARAFLAKPLDLPDLRSLIGRLLREREGRGTRVGRKGPEEGQGARRAASPEDPSLGTEGSVP